MKLLLLAMLLFQQKGPGPAPEPPPPPDRDGDGVPDAKDACPDQPAGLHADAARPGCPQADRDGDSVPDAVDACPDKPGGPSTDPKKNGCPGLVEIKAGLLHIKQQVFFKPRSAEVDAKKSRKILEAVASALVAKPEIKRVEVAGLADDKGKEKVNQEISEQRAQSVRKWLIEHGVHADRVVAKGYGEIELDEQSRLSTHAQRKKNRRVEFRIIDPPQAQAAAEPESEAKDKHGKKDKRDKKAHKSKHAK
mgnify:FL=1